jgi:hypothetical protein
MAIKIYLQIFIPGIEMLRILLKNDFLLGLIIVSPEKFFNFQIGKYFVLRVTLKVYSGVKKSVSISFLDF